MKIKDILAIIFIVIIAIYNGNILKKQNDERKQAEVKRQAISQLAECENLLRSSACRATLNCINSLDDKTSNTPVARYINSLALFCVGEFDEAKKGFEYFIENAVGYDEHKENAKKHIIKIAQAKRLIRHDIGDYFVELDNVAIWRNPRSLKVYIANDFNKKQLFHDAFKSWDEKLHDMVNFYYTDNISEADIIAKAVKRETLSSTDRVGETLSRYISYANRPDLQFMYKANVHVAINFSQNVLLEDEKFYSVALHEIGHALGIFSHSPSIGDAMYPSIDTYAKARVTNRDVNTVKRLYGNI